MTRWGLWGLAVILLALPAAEAATRRGRVHPGRFKNAEWKQEQGWFNQSTSKFAYGTKNVLFGWTELLTEPYEAAVDPKRDVLEGIGAGLWNSVGQTLGGAVDLVTFPLPDFSVPLPEGGTKAF